MGLDKHQIGSLLSKVALRDREAFEALYQLTSTKLFNVIVCVVKDEHIAADLLHEGFVKLWYSSSRFPVDYPWAWLCQSMRNLAIDEVRKQGKQREKVLASFSEDHYHTAHHHVDEGLKRCLKQLNEDKRNAIVLSYQHGMSHREIVQHIKAPLGSVKSNIRRGLQELKRCLTK